jgi:aspartyl-tRNA(Asn)/glutamyl-tRNA(Gln) amidotransferase subunit B
LKESEDDYGYIIEPDLVTIDITPVFKKEMQALIPELADAKQKRYISKFGVAEDDAFVMSSDLTLAHLYEAVSEKINPVLTAKWFRKELLGILNYHKKNLNDTDIAFGASEIIELFTLLEKREISDKTGRDILESFVTKGPFSAKEYVTKHNLQQMSGDDELRSICKNVIANNEKAVLDFKAGEEKSLRFLIGQIMKETKGKADPRLTDSIMREELK